MASYILDEQTLGVNALITISLPVPKASDPNTKVLSFIAKSKLPMLDIYGSLDLESVVDSARDRQLAGKDNLYYQQIKIENEGRLYLHADGLLEKRIYSWIDKKVLDGIAGSGSLSSSRTKQVRDVREVRVGPKGDSGDQGEKGDQGFEGIKVKKVTLVQKVSKDSKAHKDSKALGVIKA